MLQCPALARTAPANTAPIVVFAAALLAAIVLGSAALQTYLAYRAAIARAERETFNAQHALVEHGARSFEGVRRAMEAVLGLRRDVASGLIANRRTIHDMLRAIQENSPVIVAIDWIDHLGARQHSSQSRDSPSTQDSDQEHFHAHRDRTNAGLFIDVPTTSALHGGWVVPVSLRIEDHDGGFGGIVLAYVKPDYFSDFYRSFDLGTRNTTLLMRRDGVVLARDPVDPSWFGRSLENAALFREHLIEAERGTYQVVSPIDGVERIVSYGAVPGLPMVIAVSIKHADALAPFYETVYTEVARSAVALIVIGAGAWLLVMTLRRQDEATRAMTEKTALLESVFSVTAQGICILDDELRLVACNERCRRYFNDSDGALLRVGRSLESILRELQGRGEYGDDAGAVAVQLKHARAGNPISYERRRRDGTVFCVEWMPMANGYLAIAHTDITRRTRVEDALRESEERLRGITANLPVVVYRRILGADGTLRYTYINQHLADFFGVTPEEGIADSGRILAAVHDEDRDGLVQSMRDSAATLAPWQHDFRVVRPDNTTRWMRAMAQPHRANNGEVVWDGVVDDITERRAVEDALKLSESRAAEAHARLSDAVECLVDGFLLWDKDDRLVLFNRAARAAQAHYGDPRGDWLQPGLTFRELMERRVAVGLVPGAKADPEGYVAERTRRHRNPDGMPVQVRFADGHWASIREQMTQEGGIVSIRTDITAMKRHEEALAEAKAVAEAATAAKSSFLAAMSHEIRTPMNGVIGMVNLMLATRLDEQQRHWAVIARDSAEALLTIINDILDFSKIEAGKVEFERIAFSPAALGNTVESLLRPKARDKGLHFSVTASSRLPGWVMGDPTRWRQVLINLVGNAIKFTDKGSVDVSLDWRPETGGEGRLHVVVADTGIGLSTEATGRLFGKFVQADQSITRRFGGTGLGLAICHELVDRMGGRIGVESEEGRGSRFWYWIPAPVADRSAEHGLPAVDVACTSEKPLRVLVAEDNRVNQMVIQSVLAQRGHEADLVFDGTEAVEAVKHRAYDLVLMDMQMPAMDGLTAARRIRALDLPCRDVPIVALTANVSQENRAETLAAGMNDHVAKPIDPVKLFQAIARATGTSARSPVGPVVPDSVSLFAAPPPDAEALDALDTIVNSLPARKLGGAA